ncbi:hypothetical protein KJ590_00425 [Patescibacteria group bacterium]|nr:hypothetical protein [Patescibacteria group bacterium]MBU4142453.1 hypothetical protein [Patescibacteria group bacterium]
MSGCIELGGVMWLNRTEDGNPVLLFSGVLESKEEKQVGIHGALGAIINSRFPAAGLMLSENHPRVKIIVEEIK